MLKNINTGLFEPLYAVSGSDIKKCLFYDKEISGQNF